MVGDFLRRRADLATSVPRRIVDLDLAYAGFYRRHDRREGARTGYHVRLLRPREPTLEFSATHGDRRCDSNSTRRAVIRETRSAHGLIAAAVP